MTVDVLIVGAGPTGLMLANQLARRGVRVSIIDRHAGPSRETRALGVQSRTLEIYARLGVVDRALELGKPATGANLWADGRKTAHLPFGDAGQHLTPYPYILVLGQDDNERILNERLHDWNIAVEWNCELVGIDQSAERALATLRSAGGQIRKIDVAWVCGCDGARSTVRTLTGIEFPGEPYEHVFFVADVEMTGAMVPDQVNVYLWRSGFHLLFPMRGQDHWRIVGILPPDLHKTDVRFDDLLPSLHEEAGDTLAIRSCSWFSTYRIHHRAAERFRDGRCFLLGDAAHIHSPVGAQGMNTGLQDAYNLGWKLALVVQQRAGAALLDSYEAERIPVARQLLDTTDRAFRFIVADNPVASLLRTRVVARLAALAMRRPRIQQTAFRRVSQIDIAYRDGPLAVASSGLPSDAPRAGDRFPWLRLQLDSDGAVEDLFDHLDDTRFTLLVFGSAWSDAAVAPLGDLLRVIRVAESQSNAAELARQQVPLPSIYLLRPDGYIGLSGARLDADDLLDYAAGPLWLEAGA